MGLSVLLPLLFLLCVATKADFGSSVEQKKAREVQEPPGHQAAYAEEAESVE